MILLVGLLDGNLKGIQCDASKYKRSVEIRRKNLYLLAGALHKGFILHRDINQLFFSLRFNGDVARHLHQRESRRA